MLGLYFTCFVLTAASVILLMSCVSEIVNGISTLGRASLVNANLAALQVGYLSGALIQHRL